MPRALWIAILTLALCLTSSSRADDSLAASDGGERLGWTLGGGMLGASAGIGVGALSGFLLSRGCRDTAPVDEVTNLGCDWSGVMLGIGLSGALLPLGVGFGTYVPHSRLGGRGAGWAAALGTLVGSALAVTEVALISASSSDLQPGPFVGALVGAALLSSAVPTLALEWSHSRRSRLARPERRTSRLAISPQATLLREGAWFGVTGKL